MPRLLRADKRSYQIRTHSILCLPFQILPACTKAASYCRLTRTRSRTRYRCRRSQKQGGEESRERAGRKTGDSQFVGSRLVVFLYPFLVACMEGAMDLPAAVTRSALGLEGARIAGS